MTAKMTIGSADAEDPSQAAFYEWDRWDDAQLMAMAGAWSAQKLAIELPAKPALDQYINTITPRSVFLKTLPPRARVLDMGAGDGGLSTLKSWPAIERPDLKLYGVSLREVAKADHYEQIEIGNIETDAMNFGGISFDAIVACHFIEHISDLSIVWKYYSRMLRRGGRIYLEWPHPLSKRLPTREFFRQLGLPVMTANFPDDPTHIETWSMSEISRALATRNYACETVGRVHFPYVGDVMRDYAREHNDAVAATLGLWFRCGWAQYIVATRL